MKEDDLEDVTDYDYADTPKIASGWYIKLETGEKVVSRSITYGGIVVFTTYLSKCSGSERADMCTTIGDGRLYALEYKTGKAAFNFDTSNDVDTNGDGVVDEVLAHTDRYMELSGLPTAPVLIMTKEGPQLLVGTTEGIVKLDLPGDLSVNRYYWKQL